MEVQKHMRTQIDMILSYMAIGCLALLAVAVVFSTGVSGAVDVERLAPTFTFDVRSLVPDGAWQTDSRIRGFLARSNGLYYLVAVGPVAREQRILQTTETGSHVSTFASLPANIQTFDVDAGGNVWVLHGRELTVVSARDKVVKTLGLESSFRDFCLAGTTPVLVSKDGGIHVVSADGKTRKLSEIEPSPSIKVSPINSVGFLAINGVNARGRIGRVTGGVGRPFVVNVPEIDVAKQWYRGRDLEDRGVLIPAVTASRAGTTTAIVMGHSLRRGGVVLELDQDGNVTRSMRCELPSIAGFISTANPTGRMSPTLIGANDVSLFLVDIRGVTAVYAPYH